LGVLAWPGVVLILGLAFIFTFRTNIGRFLDRTKSVGKEGLRAYDEPNQQQQQPIATAPSDALTKHLETYHNPLILEVEANISRDLKERGLTDPNEANKALVKSLASVQLLWEFEKVENNIFASQVDALTFLNTRVPHPTALNDLEPFYSRAAAKYPKLYENFAFQNWLQFLTGNVLVLVNQDGGSITIRGREYLKARVDQGRSGPFWG
jgi:hypothetical protein